MVDINVLKELLMFNSTSGNEAEVADYVTGILVQLGFEVKQDNIGNVYAVRGKSNKYPLLNAHMDIVSGGHFERYDSSLTSYSVSDKLYAIVEKMKLNDVKKLFTCSDCVYGRTSRYTNVICGNSKEEICHQFQCTYAKLLEKQKEIITLEGNSSESEDKFKLIEEGDVLKGDGTRILGGDDKCGIYIALSVAYTLRQLPMKILFTVQEESGCVGISRFANNNVEWFQDIEFSITIDRRGGDNLLWSQLGTRSCTNEFAGRLANVGVSVGIPVKIEDGSVADVIYIREIVKDSVNISAGYYNPHSTKEYIRISEVNKITEWVTNFCIKECSKC